MPKLAKRHSAPMAAQEKKLQLEAPISPLSAPSVPTAPEALTLSPIAPAPLTLDTQEGWPAPAAIVPSHGGAAPAVLPEAVRLEVASTEAAQRSQLEYVGSIKDDQNALSDALDGVEERASVRMATRIAAVKGNVLRRTAQLIAEQPPDTRISGMIAELDDMFA